MPLTITGIQEAQEANLAHIRSLKPGGALEQAVRMATILAQQSAVRKTHVVTGSLRASHRVKVMGLRGEVYIDPSSTNPRSGARPAEYGTAEHRRGGSHAFYQRVIDEDGTNIARAAANTFLRGFAR